MLQVKEPILPELVRGEKRIEMTYEQFLEFCDEDVHAEWEDGEIIVFMPPGPRHQDIVMFLSTVMRLFAEFFQLGKVLPAPLEMKASPTSNAREPDILFIARANLIRLDEARLTGPADLIVEVVSPESVTRDRNKKFEEYQAAGVKEYWVIDARPQLQRAEFWVLDTDGHYQAKRPDRAGVYRSTILKGFWLDIAWLSALELPDPLQSFAKIVGFPPEMLEALRQIAARGPDQT